MSKPLRVFTYCLSLSQRSETALRLSSGRHKNKSMQRAWSPDSVPTCSVPPGGQTWRRVPDEYKSGCRALSTQTVKHHSQWCGAFQGNSAKSLLEPKGGNTNDKANNTTGGVFFGAHPGFHCVSVPRVTKSRFAAMRCYKGEILVDAIVQTRGQETGDQTPPGSGAQSVCKRPPTPGPRRVRSTDRKDTKPPANSSSCSLSREGWHGRSSSAEGWSHSWDGPMRCYRCKGYGHFAKDCPSQEFYKIGSNGLPIEVRDPSCGSSTERKKSEERKPSTKALN